MSSNYLINPIGQYVEAFPFLDSDWLKLNFAVITVDRPVSACHRYTCGALNWEKWRVGVFERWDRATFWQLPLHFWGNRPIRFVFSEMWPLWQCLGRFSWMWSSCHIRVWWQQPASIVSFRNRPWSPFWPLHKHVKYDFGMFELVMTWPEDNL